MDEEKIEKFCSALEMTVSPDNEIRREAEKFIVSSMSEPNFVVAMLEIASTPKYYSNRRIDISQAAAIQLKNMAETHWRHKDDQLAKELREEGCGVIIISEEDKRFVRDNILIAYTNVHGEIVAKQFDYAIRCISKEDFPTKWPELAHIIKEYINQEDGYDSKVFVGLYTLKNVCKRYEYEFKEKREPLNEIVDELFPRLEEIANQVLNDNSDQGCRLKNIIGHGFYIANQLGLCTRYRSTESLDALVVFFKTGLEAEIDEHLTTKTEGIETIDERIKSHQWKLKETSMHFLFRIFQKYGNPEFIDKDNLPIAEHCFAHYSEGIINLSMTLISKSQEIFIYSKVLNYCFKVVNTGFNYVGSYGFIKDNIEKLLSTYTIPLLFLTEKDIEEFEGDPIEFVRKSTDVTISFYSSKGSVKDFITMATKFRSNKDDETVLPDYLEYFFSFGMENLYQYCKEESPDYRIKDALLLAVGTMSDGLNKYSQFYPIIETMLKEGVFPDFLGDNEILGYRACWIYGRFARMPMEIEHRLESGKQLLSLIWTPKVITIIKITASSSLYKVLKNKDLKESFKPELPRILESYLQLIDDVDNDELISGLEEIVNIYEDSIEPFALELCQKIVDNYK